MISAHSVSLYKPIWGTPNLLDPGAPECSSLAQHGQNRPGVTVTGLKETKPGLEGPQCVGSAQENGKWGIEASERLWTIFNNILLAWFDITTYPLVIIYLNIRKNCSMGVTPSNPPKGQRLPWRSTSIMYVCTVCRYVRTYGGNLIEVWELNMGIDININVTNYDIGYLLIFTRL